MNNSDRTQIEAAIMSSEIEEKKRDAKEIEAAEEEPKVRLLKNFGTYINSLSFYGSKKDLDPSKLVLTSSNCFLTGPI